MIRIPAWTDVASDPGVPASLWEPAESDGSTVTCTACAHRCRLEPGQQGICRVWKNVAGELRLLTYGQVYASRFGIPRIPDPIEKEPLYHFAPGSRVRSFGGASCNFSCDFCQNNPLSFSPPDALTLRELTPAEVPDAAAAHGCEGVAWTDNEPTIYAEYVRDAARAARADGLNTAIVTNGYFTPEFVDQVGPHLDAANIDIKGVRDRPHIRIMGGKLGPTRNGVELFLDHDVPTELTYLTIPDLNDDPDEIRSFAKRVAALDPELPIHFTQFHPDHEMLDRPRTPVETLETAYDIATDVGLEFVYVGNVPGHEHNSTYSPDCSRARIGRRGYESRIQVDFDGSCECGRGIPIRDSGA